MLPRVIVFVPLELFLTLGDLGGLTHLGLEALDPVGERPSLLRLEILEVLDDLAHLALLDVAVLELLEDIPHRRRVLAGGRLVAEGELAVELDDPLDVLLLAVATDGLLEILGVDAVVLGCLDDGEPALRHGLDGPLDLHPLLLRADGVDELPGHARGQTQEIGDLRHRTAAVEKERNRVLRVGHGRGLGATGVGSVSVGNQRRLVLDLDDFRLDFGDLVDVVGLDAVPAIDHRHVGGDLDRIQRDAPLNQEGQRHDVIRIEHGTHEQVHLEIGNLRLDDLLGHLFTLLRACGLLG